MTDTEVSGFVDDGVAAQDVVATSESYVMMQEIDSHGCNSLVKASRNGKWYLLKGLKPEYRQIPLFQQIQQKEYELMRSLNHPNIVSCFGMEEVPGLGLCIVIEYVKGQSMRSFLKNETSMPAEQFRRIAVRNFQEVAEALKYIHGRQIVHRDLKPENVMITDNGQNAKLIDFGLSDSDLFAVLKQPAGTPKYIAPELNQGFQADVRADIYSYGVGVLEFLEDKRMKPLASKYRKIARKCTAPLEKRLQNADELLALLHKAEEKRPWWQRWFMQIPILLIVALAINFCIRLNQDVEMLEGTHIPMSQIDSITIGYSPSQKSAFMQAMREFTDFRENTMPAMIQRSMEERDRFVRDFTPDSIMRMSKEDFDIRNPRGFRMRLRNEMRLLGDMTEFPPLVHAADMSQDSLFRQNCIQMARTIGYGYLGSRMFHSEIVPHGPLRNRLLAVYLPNRYLPILGEYEAQMILEQLVPDSKQRMRFVDNTDVEAANLALKRIHEYYPCFQGWTLPEFAYFLIHYYPNLPK